MHIKKDDDENDSLGGFIAWCGASVGGFDRAYLSIDNALKAMRAKRGVYPCQECLKVIAETIEDVGRKD